MRFVIFKNVKFDIPYTNFTTIALVSTILTLSIIWYFNYFNMSKLIVLLLPAYLSNPIALWSSKVKFLKPFGKPIDLRLNWFDGKRVFGDSKTFRGFLSGVLVAVIVTIVFYFAFSSIKVNLYSSLKEALILGFLAGFGAMGGDLIRSFFKRRAGIKTGEIWFPFDDLDFVIGALLLLGVYINFPIIFILLTLIGTLTLRFVTNIFDFIFRLKKFY